MRRHSRSIATACNEFSVRDFSVRNKASWDSPLLWIVLTLLIATPKVQAQDTASESKGSHPNVLFIAVDDLRPELGCYGQNQVVSPNIDRLAASGVLFERAYCQLAVCNPSRVSVMTGLRPDTTKVWDLVTRFRDTMPDAVTMPQHFIKHGYYAASFGKIFHNPWPDNQSWSEPHQWPSDSTLWSDRAKERQTEYRKKLLAEGRPQRLVNRIRAQATEIVDVEDHEHIDGAIAKQAIESMRRLAGGDQPFFLATGFVRPHLPFVVPRKYWDLYQRDSIPLAENSSLPKDAPKFAMNTMYELRDYWDFDGTDRPDQGSLTEEQQRRLKHGYYASVSFIDAQIGNLLHELDVLGLADNTIVVLWSDHGWKLGEHNSWCKQTNYEIDARVPLIIRLPAAKGNGRKTEALVELLDLFPTLCDLANLPTPQQLEGRSLASLLDQPQRDWPHAAFNQFRRQVDSVPLMGYAMRTDRYRYVEWQDRRNGKTIETELYDHRTDPGENTNLAGATSNADLLDQLSRRMWESLPNPPAYVRPPKARPQITFRNRRGETLTVYWIDPNGKEHQRGVIEPGRELTQSSTMGHRFRVRGKRFVSKVQIVDRQHKTIGFGNGRTNQPAKKPSAAEPVTKEPDAKNQSRRPNRPNVVVCVADDWSWPHAGILGDPVVKTPHFDRVSREGVLFEHAFVSTPSCTPSRLSLLTGQHHWRLREGDSLGGSLREEFPVYTELLQKHGYQIGRFGKGVWPSKHEFRGRDSFGERYKSFKEFLKDRDPGQPFCYWHGGQDPHRPYQLGIGADSGIDPDAIRVPACLPDHPTTRGDLADYLWEVQRFDREVGEILAELDAIGELDNTIIVVSSDNGMPFPRCKATLYDGGTRVPLAIRWGANVKGSRTVADFVSLCDLAPTFLQAAGLDVPDVMTGRSLLPILLSKKSGNVESDRKFSVTGVEKHVYSYPRRALRTADYLYIRNFGPGDWPTGEVEGSNPTYNFATKPWPTDPGAFSFAIDPSPTKQLLRQGRSDPELKRFAELALAIPPGEELYDLKRDPDQINNVAGQRDYRRTLRHLRQQLDAELIRSNDPRSAVPDYRSQAVEGWPVRVSEALLNEKPKETSKALELLAEQLRMVKEILPRSATEHLIHVPIWFSPKYDGFGHSGEYHPGADWLRKQGRHPKLHRCIEFTNIPIFEKEIKRMPVLALHELAHAYHDQVLGFDQEEIKAAYDVAKNNGSYDAVLRGNGKTEKAYAMSNEREYFAETSEAFFGRNDFFPFDREELGKHDPRMTDILGRVWNTESNSETPEK